MLNCILKGLFKMKKLTNQEINVLRLLTQGFSNTEIGEKLNISRHTVKAYVSKIIEKLEAKDRAQVAYIAGCKGLL